MGLPSLSLIIVGVFLGYIAYSIYSISSLFTLPPCVDDYYCFHSSLNSKPDLNLHFFSSVTKRPINSEAVHINSIKSFDYFTPQEM